MTWSIRTEARRVRPLWPRILGETAGLDPLRLIFVPEGPGAGVEVHVPLTGALPSPRSLNLPGFGTMALRFVEGAPIQRPRSELVPLSNVARCAAGSTLQQQSVTGAAGTWGTAGWLFRMGDDAFVIGNRHVLRSLSNDQAGIAVLSQKGSQLVAALKWYEDLDASQENIWDLAVAQFANPASALARFVDDPTAPYPRRVASDIDSNEPCYKVGTNTLRTSGHVYGVGYELKCDVFGDGTSYRFEEQLYLQMHADEGDSGSVVVRSSDHAVVGLAMAVIVSTPRLIVANPLFNYGLAVTNAGLTGELPEVALVKGTLDRALIEV